MKNGLYLVLAVVFAACTSTPQPTEPQIPELVEKNMTATIGIGTSGYELISVILYDSTGGHKIEGARKSTFIGDSTLRISKTIDRNNIISVKVMCVNSNKETYTDTTYNVLYKAEWDGISASAKSILYLRDTTVKWSKYEALVKPLQWRFDVKYKAPK